MADIKFGNAYYIKLGRQGEWEQSSIEEDKARIGWLGQTLDDINQQKWDKIRGQLEKDYIRKGSSYKGALTRDVNELKIFTESTSEDVWITFYERRLWWCRIRGQVRSDETSKYRNLEGHWSDCDIEGNMLIVNQISGRLSTVQRFRGTICKVKERKDLHRLLNSKPSDQFLEIKSAKEILVKRVESGLKLLHWSDFETLVDLLFTGAGWRRLSSVGGTTKYVDIECEEPITKEMYQLQVQISCRRLRL